MYCITLPEARVQLVLGRGVPVCMLPVGYCHERSLAVVHAGYSEQESRQYGKGPGEEPLTVSERSKKCFPVYCVFCLCVCWGGVWVCMSVCMLESSSFTCMCLVHVCLPVMEARH